MALFRLPATLFALPLFALATAATAADQVSFKAGNYYVYENTPSVTISVVRSGTLAGACSVPVGVSAFGFLYGFPTAAVAGTDYDLTLPLTVDFADGQREATFTVPLLDDALLDGGKYLALTFSGSPVNCVTASPTGTAIAITDDETPAAGGGEKIGGPQEVVVAEDAGTARVPVQRSGSGAASVTYTIDTTPVSTGTLTWAAGEQSTKFVEFPVTGDAIGNYGLYGNHNRGRRYTVTLSAGPVGTMLLNTTVLLADDDGFPTGLIRLPYGGSDGLLEPVSGTIDMPIPVERVFGTQGAATVTMAIDTSVGGSADANDIDLTTASVSWADGELGVKYLHYAIKADTVVEPREVVALVFTVTGAAFYNDNSYYDTSLAETIQTYKRSVASITDSEITTASGVGWTQLNYGVREGATASLAVQRFGSTTGACSVQAAITNGAGSSNADWTATNQQTLSWAAGEGGIKYVTISAVDDALTEQPENVHVHLGNAVGTTTGGVGADAVLWLYDNTGFATGTQTVAPSRIQFVGEAYRNIDEIVANYTVQVERRGDTGGAVSTLVTALPPIGTGAVLGQDFLPLCQAVNWAAGEAGIKEVTFHVVNDTVVDPYESCRIVLSAPVGWGVLGSNTELTGSIADSEPYANATYDVTCSGATVAEGTGGSFVLTRGQADTSAPLTVRWIVHTISDLSYNGRLSPNLELPLQTGTVTWAAGEHDDRTVLLTALDNATRSSGTYSYVRVYNDSANPATVQDSAYLTFTDDDGAASTDSYDSIVTTATVQPSVAEGASTTYQLKRSGAGHGAISAVLTYTSYGSPGQAVYGRDFTVSPTTLTWADGDLGTRTITVTALTDDVIENPQVVNIGVAVTTGLGYANQVPVTILDTVGPAGEIVPLATSITQAEDATTYTLTLMRLGGTSGAVDVTYATVGQSVYVADGATPGADYVPTAGVVHWNDGEGGNKTASVTLVDDSLVEFPESFLLNAYGTSGPAVVRGSGSLVQIIDDDDPYVPPAPAFRFMHSAMAVTTADGRAPLIVRRTVATSAATVAIAVTGGTAVNGTDFTFGTQTVGFYTGTAEQVVNVYLLSGATSGRTIVLSLSEPSTGFAIASPGSVTVTIGAGGGGSSGGGGGGGDTTAPALTIVSVDGTAPSGGAVTVGDHAVDVVLTASDAVGVTAVTYRLNGGTATAASGSAPNYAINGLALQNGTNTLTVTAGDAAGNLTTRSVTITTPSPDATPPTVSVTSVGGKTPTAGAVTVHNGEVAVVIAAGDDVAVTAVTWKVGVATFAPASGSGSAWSIPGLILKAGANTLVVRASDAAGNHTDATVTITLAPRQTFTLDKERIDGDPVTPAGLGLAAGDLQRYDPLTGAFVDIAADEELVPGHSYLLAEDADAPDLPAADYQTPTGNTIGGLAQGWNLTTTFAAGTWADGSVTVSVDGGAAVGLDQAISDGLISPYCWIYDPAVGAIRLVTRNPANVPGATSAIPAGATVWLDSLSGGTVTITFVSGGAG